MTDCETCQRRYEPQTRQAMGCPYLPASPSASPWTPEYLRVVDVAMTACPGYTSTLPAAREVVEAYAHWEAGTLRDHLGGAPSPSMLDGLVALKGGIRERDAAAMAERTKKGGA